MAQTQHENVQHIDRNSGINAESWAKALAARNFRVYNGVPMIEKDGALAPLPVPNLGNPVVLALIGHAWAEYCRNRIGGSLNGVSLVDAIARVSADGSGAPNAKSNNAFDSIYADRIAELLDAAKGWNVDSMTKEQRAERTKLIDSYGFTGSAAAANKTKHYDAAVKAGLEMGATAGAKRDTKRKPASQKESGEL